MEQKQPQVEGRGNRRMAPLIGACLLMCALAVLIVVVARPRSKPEPPTAGTSVPLGVEQAIIIRYSGPRLQARPYRRGASVNLRIAEQAQRDNVRVYDVRYVVSLPGKFDLTEYLTSTDGRPIDDLPSFVVEGLTSLTKDIESRIREIETVGVGIWHGYYETLAALGVFWVAWLVGLIFIGRPKRPPQPPPAPPQPSLSRQIDDLLAELRRRDLTVGEKARLEALLLRHWRVQLGLADRRMAASCRDLERSAPWGPLYRRLQDWLHNPRGAVGPEQFLASYAESSTHESRTAEPAP